MPHTNQEPRIFPDQTDLEVRLINEISCLKSALANLETLRDEPGYHWAYEFYLKVISRRETMLRGLTEWKSPVNT